MAGVVVLYAPIRFGSNADIITAGFSFCYVDEPGLHGDIVADLSGLVVIKSRLKSWVT